MTITALINELKEQEQDFELYPSTPDMIKTIWANCDDGTWLDIGAGTCNFKKYFNKFSDEYNTKWDNQMKLHDASYNCYTHKYEIEAPKGQKKGRISKYYVIEKSQILIKKFDNETICIDTNFDTCCLFDKPVTNIFCNPPYSQYEDWFYRIVSEANVSNAIFLIVPQRWKNNEKLVNVIKQNNYLYKVLDSFDFLNAERSARAKVDILKIYKQYNGVKNDKYNNEAFERFFDEFFHIENDKRAEWEIEKDKTTEIKNQLTTTDSKAKILVDLYNQERQELFDHFTAIAKLGTVTLKTLGIEKKNVLEAIKLKSSGLKCRYWKIVFDEFDEITDRLTSWTRNRLMDKFQNIQTIDFTIENIYPILLWVLKNANKYYDEQLLDFFKLLTSPENIKNYVSNKRVFQCEKYRWNNQSYFKDKQNISHYVLDYRMILTSIFKEGWDGEMQEKSSYDYRNVTDNSLDNIFVIARNLGFEIDKNNIENPEYFGKEGTIYYTDGKVFMKFRPYKNGNMHVKFDVEFTKAMNVECSRLLGWIKDKKDIEKEFPKHLAKGAEKYFKTNKYISLTGDNSIKLLGLKH